MEEFTITLKVKGHRTQTLTEKDGLSAAKEIVLAWFYMLEQATQQQTDVCHECDGMQVMDYGEGDERCHTCDGNG